ncbi:HMG-Y-related protein A-like [Triticum aestivum]|uniref:HMG-Y-related protein A-like n=1 Tax=Triticum aestivum TaxID=4565 RepID=UPI001D025965|nr:HMG-Y-related protein A-like [Triticum aestivum]
MTSDSAVAGRPGSGGTSGGCGQESGARARQQPPAVTRRRAARGALQAAQGEEHVGAASGTSGDGRGELGHWPQPEHEHVGGIYGYHERALGDKNGSSKAAISSYIEEKYEGLPSAHASLLTANLASMKEAGKLAFVKNNYLKADAPSATPAKRGRGRPPKPKAAPKDPNTPKRGRGRPPKAKDPMADAVKDAVAKATTGMPQGRGRPPGPSSAKKAKVA